MSEDGDFWRAEGNYQRAYKRERSEKFLDVIAELIDFIDENEIQHQRFSQWHYQFTSPSGIVVDYWPSKGKYYFAHDGTKGVATLRPVLEKLLCK